jgi:polyphosphate glucokinase
MIRPKGASETSSRRRALSDARSGGRRSGGDSPLQRRDACAPSLEDSSSVSQVRTLAIDVGGTALKAAVLDDEGAATAPDVRALTPHPCPPEALVGALADLTAALSGFERVSVGFPGVVRDGRVLTAPHLGQDSWIDYPLAASLQRLWGKPVRVSNDAEVHGLGIVTGHGLEMVVTLGTGVGTSLFRDGRAAPHLELAHHPLRGGRTYDEYLGIDAFRRVGIRQWNARLRWVIDVLFNLIRYDTLYLGGGNSAKVVADLLPANVRLAPNAAGLIGGIRLWNAEATPDSNQCRCARPGIQEGKRRLMADSAVAVSPASTRSQCGCGATRDKP